MPTHYSFEEIGRVVARRWGRTTKEGESLSDMIMNMDDPKTQVALLAAILRRLDSLESSVYIGLQPDPPRKPRHPACGMLDGLRQLDGSRKCGDLSLSDGWPSLSGRAKRALWLLRARPTSEITHELVMAQRNCGPATATEIMAFISRNGTK